MCRGFLFRCGVLCVLATWCIGPRAAEIPPAPNPLPNNVTPTPHPIRIPRLDAPPTLEEFLTMQPNGGAGSKMSRVEGFTQSQPRDGEPSTQRTEGYVGYDHKHLYVVYVCFDEEPEKIRARMTRRENAWGDDWVELTLDTFHDQRRGYVFWSNALGVQAEGLWVESESRPDWSYDMVWDSDGRRTAQGYVVMMRIPFRSLRFQSSNVQTWGITLQRVIPRINEWSYWPRVSSNVRGRLSQDAEMSGLANISPGRNIQINPYGAFRSFRAIDTRDPAGPVVARKDGEVDGGVDAKFVLKDKLVFDVTVNPDFAQVESDDPQIVANQRFEVFFPEKRPFFLENSSFFQVANGMNLLFTRRIADPQFGARVTGKIGKYAIGAIIADDQSPGRIVAASNPLADKRALFGVVRVTRDIFKQSSIGAMFTSREFENAHNRVASVDSTIRFSEHWQGTVQAATSSTKFLNGSTLDGPLYTVSMHRSGRKFFGDYWFNDISPGFRTQTGFVRRTDLREVGQFSGYNFRPENRWLISWGPDFSSNISYDHEGTRLDWDTGTSLEFEFAGNSFAEVFYSGGRQRLRPRDFAALAANQDYSRRILGVNFNTDHFKRFSLGGEVSRGHDLNFVPRAGLPPQPADRDIARLNFTLRPTTPLVIAHQYIMSRLREHAAGSSIFTNHIIRQNWNWQFNRELSLRVILQYEALLANQANTSLETDKNFNADFLVTWLLHPGTALYVGYNSNLVNRDIFPCAPASGCSTQFLRTNDFRNDAKGLFVKFSYLFRL